VRGSDRLLVLQELDLAVDRLRARQRALESGEDMVAARARADHIERAVGELRLALGGVDREASRLENDADMLGRKADAEERRMYDGSVANPKELESIRHEVQSLKERRRRIDDELLERLVEREDLDTKIAGGGVQLQEARDRLSEIRGAEGAELADIERELAARGAEREAMLPEFDEELLRLYEDLRRTKRGVGAAALVDGVCQGCHQKISSAEMARLKSADIKRCEYCDRILVQAPPAPQEASASPA
jgi:predicted  nucleic acid-binding Zn-ribbon protein